MDFLNLLIISLCFNLYGCALTLTVQEAGAGLSAVSIVTVLLLIIGVGIAYGGYKLATKTTLEQWAMKLLNLGLLIFIIG
jgi:hypothetical protein